MEQVQETVCSLHSTNKSSEDLSRVLIDEIGHYAVTSLQQDGHKSVEELTYGYLYQSGGGQRIWGPRSELSPRPFLAWPSDNDRIEDFVRQTFSKITQLQYSNEHIASTPKESPAHVNKSPGSGSNIIELENEQIIDLEDENQNGATIQSMNEDHSGLIFEIEDSDPLSDVPSAMFKADGLPTSDPPNQSMMHSYLIRSGYSGQLPLIAQSEMELVAILASWMQEHNGTLPPGAIKGSILNVKDHIAKKLYFTGTSELILIDRLLINKTTIGWVLRARDGSCLYTRHDGGNGQEWHGYRAWTGHGLVFTNAILASTDGTQHKPLKRNGKGSLIRFNRAKGSMPPNDAPLKQDKNDGLGRDYSNRIKIENDSHRYPTQERRLASFSYDFETWASQGNTGIQTPTHSDSNMMKTWPPKHPGAPPSTPQKQPTRQQSHRKVKRAFSRQSNASRSSSVEVIHRVSPRSHKIAKPCASKKQKGSDRYAPTAKLPPTPKTRPLQASTADITPSPITPKSKKLPSVALKADSTRGKNIVFHFFLSNEDFGAIPKLFIDCATPASFFNEAKSAWHAIRAQSKETWLMGVKVTIEGVMRPIMVLWENEDGYERMLEAISDELLGKAGKLNVEVRGVQFGQLA